jgi:hypothetical protein
MIFFLRKVKAILIMIGIAIIGLGLGVLFKLSSGNRVTGKPLQKITEFSLLSMPSNTLFAANQTRPAVARATYLRNILHYALWWKSSDIDYRAMFSALIEDLFSSPLYYIRRHQVPAGYRRISWRCVSSEIFQ